MVVIEGESKGEYNCSQEVWIMTFPVLVESYNGEFAATLVGEPTSRAVGSTRDAALAALQAEDYETKPLGSSILTGSSDYPRRLRQ
jgi:hypothetical protein